MQKRRTASAHDSRSPKAGAPPYDGGRMPVSLTSSRLAIVSGKGGVGKTTVAAALALAAARAGKRTLLIEVEEREGIAPLFGESALGYQERPLAPSLNAMSVVPDEALVEYLYLFYGIGRVGKVLKGTKAVEFATNIAPGLRDILLIGKVKEAERRRIQGRYAYDFLVLDAPPTGRLPRFLEAPRSVVELVRSGPIRQQAQGVIDMVYDPKRCRVVLVTLPEDMPVRETAESVETLGKMGVALGPLVVNGLYPEVFPPDALRVVAKDAASAIAADAERAGIALAGPPLDQLAAVAGTHARRTMNQHAAVKELRKETSMDAYDLPYLFTPRITRAELEGLAAALQAQGAVA
jgi:anion-transporting  ArsA/GET3 family ATPase